MRAAREETFLHFGLLQHLLNTVFVLDLFPVPLETANFQEIKRYRNEVCCLETLPILISSLLGHSVVFRE
jgi:hypothetical protein